MKGSTQLFSVMLLLSATCVMVPVAARGQVSDPIVGVAAISYGGGNAQILVTRSGNTYTSQFNGLTLQQDPWIPAGNIFAIAGVGAGETVVDVIAWNNGAFFVLTDHGKVFHTLDGWQLKANIPVSAGAPNQAPFVGCAYPGPNALSFAVTAAGEVYREDASGWHLLATLFLPTAANDVTWGGVKARYRQGAGAATQDK
jgi:hypothetical protein